jgi:hypothetical protein
MSERLPRFKIRSIIGRGRVDYWGAGLRLVEVQQLPSRSRNVVEIELLASVAG